ncbi:uncharacterized protein LOC143853151 [Tasmannia lanceolata]|uniref:uncharacterized protein LOC143853151 n=1 Tax=Tasmannia lanceolata TaxID=3420 RepID=UPI00406387C8
MGYLYEAMDKAKENIKERLKRKSDYNPIWRIIDQRWDRQLHSSLHAAGYFLNPALFFTPTFSRHSEVTRGLLACITRLVPDEGTQDLITNQIEDYREAKGMFGMKLAIRNRTKLGPVAWWNQFGGDVEELQTFAIRILSQTCSATGCERNWSTFEHIHSAKRNRLEHQRLDDLVFVHYNLKFRERDLLRKSSTTSDPLSIDHLDVMMDWVAEEEDVIFTPEDIGWENLEAPTVMVGAGDDNDDFLMPLEEDVHTGGSGTLADKRKNPRNLVYESQNPSVRAAHFQQPDTFRLGHIPVLPPTTLITNPKSCLPGQGRFSQREFGHGSIWKQDGSGVDSMDLELKV